MGTITRNFANNLTTSGLLKPDAFNNDSFDNVTAVPSGSVETGDMQFISSATASASASIEFTSGIDSTYKEYVFYLVNIHPATDGQKFSVNFSTDGGSSYNVTKTTTNFQAQHNEADTVALLLYKTGDDLAQSTGYQVTSAAGVGSDNDQQQSGIIKLYNPSSTTFVKHFTINTCTYQDNDNMNNAFIGGYCNTTSAINAIDFKFSSGNIDSGEILLFGVN